MKLNIDFGGIQVCFEPIKWFSCRSSSQVLSTSGDFKFPFDEMQVQCCVTAPSIINSFSTHLHTRVERGTFRAKCLGKEKNALTLARI